MVIAIIGLLLHCFSLVSDHSLASWTRKLFRSVQTKDDDELQMVASHLHTSIEYMSSTTAASHSRLYNSEHVLVPRHKHDI